MGTGDPGDAVVADEQTSPRGEPEVAAEPDVDTSTPVDDREAIDLAIGEGMPAGRDDENGQESGGEGAAAGGPDDASEPDDADESDDASEPDDSGDADESDDASDADTRDDPGETSEESAGAETTADRAGHGETFAVTTDGVAIVVAEIETVEVETAEIEVVEPLDDAFGDDDGFEAAESAAIVAVTVADEGVPDEASDAPLEVSPRPRDPAATLAIETLVWERAADATIVRSRPQFDEHVLETGSGAAAVSTAELVGPTGRVDAIVADPLLVEADREAAGEAMPQLVVHHGGLEEWSFGDYDLVQQVLGLSAVTQEVADRTARDLAGRLRPGGRFAATVWAERAFGTIVPALLEAVVPLRPTLAGDAATFGPSIRHHGTAGSFAVQLAELGLVDVHADELPREVPLDDELAWNLVVGTELVSLLDGVDEEFLPAVRATYLASLERAGVTTVDLSMLIAVGTRPGPEPVAE